MSRTSLADSARKPKIAQYRMTGGFGKRIHTLSTDRTQQSNTKDSILLPKTERKLQNTSRDHLLTDATPFSRVKIEGVDSSEKNLKAITFKNESVANLMTTFAKMSNGTIQPNLALGNMFTKSLRDGMGHLSFKASNGQMMQQRMNKELIKLYKESKAELIKVIEAAQQESKQKQKVSSSRKSFRTTSSSALKTRYKGDRVEEKSESKQFSIVLPKSKLQATVEEGDEKEANSHEISIEKQINENKYPLQVSLKPNRSQALQSKVLEAQLKAKKQSAQDQTKINPFQPINIQNTDNLSLQEIYEREKERQRELRRQELQKQANRILEGVAKLLIRYYKIYVSQSPEKVKLRSTLEEWMQFDELPESYKLRYLSEVESLVHTLQSNVKNSFHCLELGQREKIMMIFMDTYNRIIGVRRPIGVIIDVMVWMISAMIEFGEFSRCIQWADSIFLFLYNHRRFKESMKFFKLFSQCYFLTLNPKRALVCTYQKLFAALYFRDYKAEMDSYWDLSKEYHECGDLETASYFHQKFMDGRSESDGAASRLFFPKIFEEYANTVLIPRDKKTGYFPPSPDITFFEDFHLEDHDKLEDAIETKILNNNTKSYNELRKEHFQKYKTEVRSDFRHVKNKPVNKKKRALDEDPKVGDIKWFLDEESRAPTTQQIQNKIKMSKIRFVNNTDTALLTHHSANKATNSFFHQEVTNIKTQPGNIPWECDRFEHAITDDSTLIRLLGIYNEVGLALEKAGGKLELYRSEFNIILKTFEH